jgi:hypothetical protein
VNEHFYGQPVNHEEARAELGKATLINALGEQAVRLVREVKGDIEVLDVNGISYTIIVKVFK